MRFLIITKAKQPLPPQTAPALFDAMAAWIDDNLQSGKIEQTWGFAGIQGGGGILNVSSFEELDHIMARMPFGPFSEIEIYGPTDVKEGLATGKQAVMEMVPGV